MAGNHTLGDAGSARTDLPLPPRLQGTLERFRERLWSIKIAEGALAGLIGLGLSYVLVFSLDRVYDTPAWLRAVLLFGGFGIPAVVIPILWHRWVWRQRTLADAARYLRRHHPRMGDELLGIVELAHRQDGSASPLLVTAAMKQVDERIGDRDFSDSVPTRRHRRRLAALATIGGISALLALLSVEASRNALMRWASPWRALDRYTFAQIEPVPAEIVVPFAEPFPLSPKLTEGTEWKPDEAVVKLPGATRLAAARRDEGYAFDIPPQKDPGTLALRVGDARERIAVTPLPRPELVSLEAVVRLPDYLRYAQDPVIEVRGNTLPVVEGASVSLRATTTRALAAAEMDGQSVPLTENGFTTPPLAAHSAPRHVFTWSDVHGLQAKSPLELSLSTVPDASPEVYAHQVEAKRMILIDEVVGFDIRANDDHGLREVGLEWTTPVRGSDEIIRGEKLVSAGDPEKRSLETRGTFSGRREGLSPGAYQVRVYAVDYLPNRERAYSPAFHLVLLSPQEHARWLTEEFSKWFRGARETYEREQLLHESNLALRELSPEELDQPENRRKLQEQSAAESANARRLDALTTAGRGLVGEATKNPEFDAKRLENWAEMMRALDEIARQRMPSVADRLQQSARAPGAPPSVDAANPPATPATPPPPATPGLVGETLAAVGKEAPKATPAQAGLDRANEEQRELLDRFAKVTDELKSILASLEASTFVKRLKAAARKQTELSDTLHQGLAESFGMPTDRLPRARHEAGETAAREQEEQSRFVHLIQSDLEAYYQRKQEPIYKNVLQQMKDQSVVSGLKRSSDEIRANLNGRSAAASQYWADTLDRWAEELVAAAPDQQQDQQGQQKDSKSLPPEIVLKIMKAIQGEMQLRDETREMEETKPALARDVYASRMKSLELNQTALRETVDEALSEIQRLPDAREFGREAQLLTTVSDIMRRAHAVLARPDSGPEAIAYETEAIELLLQSKRQSSGGGGGGGGGSGSSNNGGNQGGGNGSALSDVGPQGTGGTPLAPVSREVEQNTGRAGKDLPEEFRRGLDAYFNEIDSK